jgi:hypothetical protein
VLPDQVPATVEGGQTVMVEGLQLAPGMSKTIDVRLWGFCATKQPWTVRAYEVAPAGTTKWLTFAWAGANNKGVDGDVLKLTVSVSKKAVTGVFTTFVLESASTDGKQDAVWGAAVTY